MIYPNSLDCQRMTAGSLHTQRLTRVLEWVPYSGVLFSASQNHVHLSTFSSTVTAAKWAAPLGSVVPVLTGRSFLLL